jgi:hypothetical protein
MTFRNVSSAPHWVAIGYSYVGKDKAKVIRDDSGCSGRLLPGQTLFFNSNCAFSGKTSPDYSKQGIVRYWVKAIQ